MQSLFSQIFVDFSMQILKLKVAIRSKKHEPDAQASRAEQSRAEHRWKCRRGVGFGLVWRRLAYSRVNGPTPRLRVRLVLLGYNEPIRKLS